MKLIPEWMRRPGATTGALAILMFLLLPILVVGFSFLVQRLFFSQSRDDDGRAGRRTATRRLTTQTGSAPCPLVSHAGLLVTVECGASLITAPLAGLRLSDAPAAGRNVDRILDQLQLAHHDGRRLTCTIVTAITAAADLESYPFASCRADNANLSELLVTAGATVAAPADALTMRVLQDKDQQRLAALSVAPAEGNRPAETRLLQIQAWLATLYGLVGVVIGIVYKVLEDSVKASNTHARLRKELIEKHVALLSARDAFNAVVATKNNGIDEASLKQARRALEELATAFKEFRLQQNETIPLDMGNKIQASRAELGSLQTATGLTATTALIVAVEDFLGSADNVS